LNTTVKKRITIYMSNEDREELKELSIRLNKPLTDIVRESISEYLKDLKDQQKCLDAKKESYPP